MARTSRGFALNAQKIKTKLRNDTTFATYYNMLRNMALTSFKWDNLPISIDPAFLEEMLYTYGLVAVFNDEVVGLVALPAMQAGGFDIYGGPKMVRAFSPRTGFSVLLKHSPDPLLSDCILIYNTNRDLNSSSFKSSVGLFSERLGEMKRTEDVNIYAQRTPITTVVPQGQVETYLNLLDRYNNFGQTVVGYSGLDVDAIKCIKTDAPFVADKIDELFIKTWNEAISFLGISNVSVYKKERVSTDEVQRAMGGALAFRNVRQEPRERACELIKAKWGLDVKVTFSEELFDPEMFGDEQETKTGYNRDEQEGGEGNA